MRRRYYSGIVRDNADPEQRGRLRLEVVELFGAGVASPEWIDPRIVAPAAGAVGWLAVPEIGAVVVVEANGPGADPATRGLRWLGGRPSRLPAALRVDYPHRAGASSPDGSATAVLGPDLAALLAAAVRLGASEAAATQAPVVESLLTALSGVLDEVIALGLAALPSPIPTPNALALKTAIAAGSHRSTSVRVD